MAANLNKLLDQPSYHFICKMGRKGVLTEPEKSKIIKGLHKKQSTLEIGK